MSRSKVNAEFVDNTDEAKDVDIIRRNGQTISTDTTIDSDQNAISVGPITQDATITVSGNWTIV
jgi:hypothetical protein